MKKLALALFFLTSLSYASQYDPVKGEMLSLSCFSCHGTNGQSKTIMPSIAGIDKDELYNTLMAYKRGTRTGTMMQKHVKGFSDEELKQIAQYLSTVEKD